MTKRSGWMLGMLCVLGSPLWVNTAQSEPVEYVPAVAWGQQNDWRTRQSEHFEIIYPDGLQLTAEKALNIAEQVRADLQRFFVQMPTERTLMVLVDDFDYSNGFSTPLPQAAIRLYTSPPDGGSGLEEYDDWLHMLIRHEYTHTLHMELGRGPVTRSRQVFGRAFFNFPHLFTPSFLLEGLAVYQETSRDGGYGRLQGSFYEMAMRAEMLASGGDAIGQTAAPLRDWPLDKSYLYGAWFIDWLITHYGEDKLREFLLLYSGRLLPYVSLEGDARRVFGHSFSFLWLQFMVEWQQRARDWQQQHPDVVDGEPVPVATLFRPLLATDGHSLYSIERNGDDREVARRRSLANPAEAEDLFYPETSRSLTVAPSGALALVRIPFNAGGQEWGDVYVWKSDEEERLTTHLRARRLAWLDDGKTLMVSRLVGGRSELLTLDVASAVTRSVWQGQDGDVLGEFDVRADGRYLVAAIKRAGRSWNLEQLDLASGQWQTLTDTAAIENSPRYLPNGDVLFSADTGGQYNLYRLTPGSSERQQLTNVSTAAFAPLVIGDQLLYVRYTAQGYRVEQQPVMAPVLAQASNQSGGRQFESVVQLASQTAVAMTPESAYSPWSSLAPKAWYPSFSANRYHVEAGVLLSGSDALGRHRYTAQLRQDFQHDLTSGLFDYALDNRWWLRAQRAFRYPQLATDDNEHLIIQRDDISLERHYLWSALEDRLALHAGVVYAREDLRDDGGLLWTGPQRLRQGLTGVALEFDDREDLLNVPGAAYGSRWDLVLETNDWIDSDFHGEQLQGRWNEVIDLPGRDTLNLHLHAGVVDPEGGDFMLGGGPEYDEELFGRDTVSLMGYAEGVRYGTRYHKERISWTHWLGRSERNARLLPVGSGDYSMTLYTEAGAAWSAGEKAEWLPAVGLEAHAELVIGYRMIMPLVLGVARGLDDEGESQVYLGVGVNY